MNFSILTFFCLLGALFAQDCTNPKISDIQTFTSQDLRLNTETSYVVQFRVQCTNNAKNLGLFAEINGLLLTSSSDESGEKYQIGWSEPHKTARTGQIKLRLFDEEGFSALKKAQRNNEDVSKVKELRIIDFYHQGLSSGPYVQNELFVTILFAVVYYWASKHRSLIQA